MNKTVMLISDDAEIVSSFKVIADDYRFAFLSGSHYNKESLNSDSDILIADVKSVYYKTVICESPEEWNHLLILLADRGDSRLSDDIILLKPSGIIFRPVDPIYAYSAIESAASRISDLKKMKKDIIEAGILSESALEAKTRFMATVSHEIRTPMNAIIGMTDLALLTNDSEEILDYLIDLKTASGKLLNLTDKILDFSKVETGKIKIEPEVFSLNNLAAAAMNKFQQQTAEKDLDFTSSISPGVADCYKGDSGRIGQILEHIISNAIKFTENGFVRVDISRSADSSAFSPELSLIRFDVIDSGIGVPPDKLSIIFDKFRQAEDSRTRNWGGTGLGLALSKSLVELMNGTIGVESSPGKGSRFYFTIPLKVEADLQKIKCERTLPVVSDDRVLRILLVEDNPVNARLAEVILKRLGHVVNTAKNGRIALEILSGNCYDVIFMDIEMPVMDGIETTRHIRSGAAGKDKANIPIVAVTAYAIEEYKNECIDTGMDYFITKPINVMLIPDILSRIKSSCAE